MSCGVQNDIISKWPRIPCQIIKAYKIFHVRTVESHYRLLGGFVGASTCVRSDARIYATDAGGGPSPLSPDPPLRRKSESAREEQEGKGKEGKTSKAELEEKDP